MIYYGNCEMDGNFINGKEKLSWRTIQIDDNTKLLICDKIINCMGYNETANETNWQTCSLNIWLNTTFYNESFDDNEITGIISYQIENGIAIPDTRSLTTNKVFILSKNEIEKYFPISSERVSIATNYCLNNGVLVDVNSNAAWWWVRSDENDITTAPLVDYLGDIVTMSSSSINSVNINYYGVRPAMFLMS